MQQYVNYRPSIVASLTAFVLLLTSHRVAVNCILSSQWNRYEDVTQDPAFGCRWTQTQLTCNCQQYAEKELYLAENSINPYQINAIKITGCPRVRFGTNAIANMLSIREVELSSITNLTLDELSLSWDGYRPYSNNEHLPSVSVKITDSHITSIATNSFKGTYGEIVLEGATIGYVSQYAFSLSSTSPCRKLAFRNVKFAKIEPQAFKKFVVEDLLLDNVQISEVPSRTFSDLTVSNKLIISNSSFNVVRSMGFLIEKPREFRVVSSEINRLEGEGFKVQTRGPVVFANNVFNELEFGAFRGISVDIYELHQLETISFVQNKHLRLTSEFLNLNASSFKSSLSKIYIWFACDCSAVDAEFSDSAQQGEIYCKYENGPEFVSVKEFKQYNCSVIASNATLIIILGVVAILVVIIASILVFYFKKIYRSDRYGEKDAENRGKNISLIVPDGKTYKETELHVIVERADLLTTDL